jgi:flagellar biosynthesis protein FlhF
MPLESFTGPDIPVLLARAHATIGADAVVVSLRRRAAPGATGFELVAADPLTATSARVWRPDLAPRRSPSPAALPSRRNGRPAVVAVVGPTGAGKTTTVAKLANHPDAFGDRAAGLLCLDTYRVGAVEQLKLYAELSGLPLEVAYESRDLAVALRRLRDCDVVLVDTAGRGPQGQGDTDATYEQLRRLAPAETHLVLPAGLQPPLARRVVEDHRERGVTHLLASKLDECPGDDTAFRLAAELGLPMRWVTDGQEVPRDLRLASAPARPVAEPAWGAA